MRGPRVSSVALALLLVGALGLVGCARPSTAASVSPASPGSAPARPPSTTVPDAPLEGAVVVLAAASLEDPFATLGERLEHLHPGLTVTFSFAGSPALAAQVVAGAPADVLATASAATMEAAAAHVTSPAVVATNELVLVTPSDNPGRVTELADLTRRDLRIALCASDVPCGAASARVLVDAGLTPAPDTYTENVTAALGLVVAGEVDAALVYRTDALRAGPTVHAIELPDPDAGATELVAAAVRDAPNPAGAEAFLELVRSDEGRAVLTDAGFEVPS